MDTEQEISFERIQELPEIRVNRVKNYVNTPSADSQKNETNGKKMKQIETKKGKNRFIYNF